MKPTAGLAVSSAMVINVTGDCHATTKYRNQLSVSSMEMPASHVSVNNVAFRSPPAYAIKPAFAFPATLDLGSSHENNLLGRNHRSQSCCRPGCDGETGIDFLHSFTWYFVVVVCLYGVILSALSIHTKQQIQSLSSISSPTSGECVDQFVDQHTSFPSNLSQLLEYWRMSAWCSLLLSSLILLVHMGMGLLSRSAKCIGYDTLDRLSSIDQFMLIAFMIDLGFLGIVVYFACVIDNIFADILESNECVRMNAEITSCYKLVNDFIWIPSLVLGAVSLTALIICSFMRFVHIWEKFEYHRDRTTADETQNDYILFSQ